MKNEKAITLIALVITIIILLIVSGITISSLTESGLIEKTQEAKNRVQNVQNIENQILADYKEQMNAQGGNSTGGNTGPTTLVSKVKIGDYVKYQTDTVSESTITSLNTELNTYSGSTGNAVTKDSLNWRVLDIIEENGEKKVRLISETPTDSTITLSSYSGYNNGVYLIDKVCNTLYNNATYAEKVKNLKIEDIQNKMKVTDYSTINSNYGKTFNPTNMKYPTIFAQEKNQIVNGKEGTLLGLSEQNELINQNQINTATSWEVKYTFWSKTMTSEEFKDSKYYEIFINKDNVNYKYWVSSRAVFDDYDQIYFVMRIINDGNVSGYSLYASTDYPWSPVYALRPVVTLKGDILIDEEKSGDGSEVGKEYILK